MKKLAALFLLFATQVHAKDVALILNDQEQQALYSALDITVKSQGITSAAAMLHLLQRLQSAPEVTGKADEPPKKDDKP